MFFSLNLISASSVGLIENSTWQSNLSAIRFSATALGDIDGDRDLDLVLTGCLNTGASRCDNGAISKIYINNGTTLTESNQWQQNLTNAGYSSISLGDIDNDGDLDLALSGCPSGTETSCNNIFSKIYLNNGTTLTESNQWQNNLTGIYSGSTKLIDINNDGRLDLGLVGYTGSTYIAKVYINNDTALIENSQWQSNLTGIRYGDLAFADVDNDGDLDVGLVGKDITSNNFVGLYINNGSNFVYDSVWTNELTPTNLGSLTFGDIDNDGDLDLAEMGIGDYLYTYRNNGTTFIKNQSSGASEIYLAGVYEGSFAFGDYDNDGDLDLVATGYEQGRGQVYENNKSQGYYFITDNIAGAGIHADDFTQNSLTWGDLDNDNDLDLVISGISWGSGFLESNIYISNASITVFNFQPTPPNLSFSSSYVNNILTLSWGNGSDSETNTSGLYYNLMVGNSTNNNTIVSGIYGGSSGGGNAGGGAAGYFGNMMQRKNIALNTQLEANKTYYWYVQTIDTSLQKSNWSAVQNFNTSLDVTKPNITLNHPSPNSSLHTTNPYFIFNATVTDTNLTNVTLYANWGGSMIANETNSSGINGTYIFNRNLTGYNDNMYSWYIYACDSVSNCQSSETRSFYLDRAYPKVYLLSPANSATWTSSSIVTFSYNVTDTDIANCSLIINNALDQTNTAISENINQTFSKSLSNGNYNWNVNCTDYVSYTNSSSIYSLSVSVSSGGTPGGGGGGGTSITTKTYAITIEQIIQGYTQQLANNDKIEFKISNVNHSLTLNNINTNLSYVNITLNSTSINFIIYVNETKKFELTNDSYYDLLVKLNNITENKINLTIKSISEEISIEKEKEAKEEVEKRKEEIKKKKLLFWIIILLIISLIIFTLIKLLRGRKKWQ